jgi:hypothetical protein
VVTVACAALSTLTGPTPVHATTNPAAPATAAPLTPSQDPASDEDAGSVDTSDSGTEHSGSGSSGDPDSEGTDIVGGDLVFPPAPEESLVDGNTNSDADPGGAGTDASTTGQAAGTGQVSANPGGVSWSDPLWFLPDPPPMEFAYTEEAYDYWLSLCASELQPEPGVEVSTTAATYPEELPAAFRDLYGDPDWSCGDDLRSNATVLDVALGSDTSIGRAGIPTSHYDIGADEGAWNHVDRRIWTFITNLLFTISKSLTMAAYSLLRWAFGFPLGDAFANGMASASIQFYGAILPWYDLALFATLCAFAFHLLRGRTTVAIGELALTYVVFVSFLALELNTSGGAARLMASVMTQASGVAGEIAATALQDQSTSVEGCPAIGAGTNGEGGEVVGLEAVACPFGQSLHAVFVERPYDLLNWGRDLGDATSEDGNCAQARDAILLGGPWGARDEPRFMMGAAGCEAEADFNHEPSADRAGLAGLMVLVTALVLVLVVVSAVTLLAAQILLVCLLAVAPFALLSGILPGSGRSMLWRWLGGLTKSILAVIAIAVFLSLYLLSVEAMATATAGQAWFVQGSALIVLTVTMFWARSNLVAASKRAGERAGQRLAQAAPSAGGTGGGMGGGFASAGRFRARHPRRYIPYEARAAYRDARQAPQNVAEWRANRRERRAIRLYGYEPSSGRAPAHGLTRGRRRRSAARRDRRIRTADRRTEQQLTRSQKRVAKSERKLDRARRAEEAVRSGDSNKRGRTAIHTYRRKHKAAVDWMDNRVQKQANTRGDRARYGRVGGQQVRRARTRRRRS